MDAIAHYEIDEVILSTLPTTSSGWLRRDLPERIEQATGLPVKHVVTDLGRDGLPFDVCLVVANQTAAGDELDRNASRPRPRRARGASSSPCRRTPGDGEVRRTARAPACARCSPRSRRPGSSPPA